MLSTKNIAWSEKTFSLMELNHDQFHLPTVVKIAEGYYDKTPDPDQMFIVYSWGAQERIVAENKNKTLISIPMYHEHRLTIYLGRKDEETLDNLPLSRIVKRHLPPVSAVFDPDVTSFFYVGDELHSSLDVGLMTLKHSHYLQYAKCCPIIGGVVHTQELHVLPVSLDIVCAVAMNIRNKPEGFLKKILSDVAKKTSTLGLGTGPLDNKLVGITGYNDLLPSQDPDYEYIEFVPPGPWGLKTGRLAKKASNFPKESSNSITQSGQPFSVLVPANPPNDSAYDIHIPQNCHDQGGKRPPKSNQHTLEPPGTVEKPSMALDVRSQGVISELEERITKMTHQKAPFRKAPVQPPKRQSNPPEIKYKGHRPLQIANVLKKNSPQEEQAVSPQRPISQSPWILFHHETYLEIPEQRESSKLQVSLPSAVTQTTSAHGADKSVEDTSVGLHLGITCLEDVPKDISTLSVSDVGDCLRLLNLQKYSNMFKEQQVDGQLLKSLSAIAIEEGFGLNSISSKKIEMFAKNGWRPAYSSHHTSKPGT